MNENIVGERAEKVSPFIEFPKLSDEEFTRLKERVVKALEQLKNDSRAAKAGTAEYREELDQIALALHDIKLSWKYGEARPIMTSIDLPAALRTAGLSESMQAEIIALSEALAPDLNETYNPAASAEDLNALVSEGRGVYRNHVLEVSGEDLEVIHYVKGLGSKELVGEHPEALFAAFPQSVSELHFDDAAGISGYPRVIGTESGLWGSHEHINSLVLYKLATDHFGITSIAEAIKKKIPIPSGLREHHDISLHLQELILQKYEYSTNVVEQSNLRWIGNWQPFVTVGTCVPGDKRFSRVLDTLKMTKSDEKSKLFHDINDLDRAKFLGHALSTMCSLGVVFSRVSSHGQNAYRVADSDLPVADYSDLLFLGSLQSKEGHGMFVPPATFLTRTERQAEAIFQMLASTDGLRPLPFPFSESGVGYDEVCEANAVFWNEITDKYDFASTPDQQAWASMYFYTYFECAVSQLILENVTDEQQSVWKSAGDLQRELLHENDPTGFLVQILDKGIDGDVPDSSVHYMRDFADSTAVAAMRKFIRTGDTVHLQYDSSLGPVCGIAELVHGLEDDTFKAEFVDLFSRMQRKRSFIELEASEHSTKNIDCIYLFENKHLERIHELLKNAQYDEAKNFTKALYLLMSLGMAQESDVHPEAHDMSISVWYGKKLLEAEPSEFLELTKQIEYFAQVREFYSKACGSLFFSVMSDDKIDIFDFVQEEGLTHPRDMIVNIMGMFYKDASVRSFIEFYLEKQNEILNKHKKTFMPDLDAILLELDEFVDEVGSSMPMLLVAHQMNALNITRRFQPEKAHSRFELAKAAYRKVEALGLSERSGWSQIAQKLDGIQWKDEYLKRADQYRKMGLTRVADRLLENVKLFFSKK